MRRTDLVAEESVGMTKREALDLITKLRDQVALVGTDGIVPDGDHHAGTFMVEGESLEFHVYEFEGDS